MKTAKCIHPIKVNKLIKAFITNVIPFPINLTLSWDDTPLIDYAICADGNNITVFIPNWKKADYTNDYGGKCFRKDFVDRCPLGRGFSDITISLLHEIGHAMTDADIPNNFCREVEYSKIRNISDITQRMFAYFRLLDEMMATDWAIDWLQDAEHRKMAKAFEKEFWACFE